MHRIPIIISRPPTGGSVFIVAGRRPIVTKGVNYKTKQFSRPKAVKQRDQRPLIIGRRPPLTKGIHPEGLPNGPYSPRRGETATQVDRGRGGIGVLGTVSSQRQSFIDHLLSFKRFQ
jgi:hypothetical protein